MNNVEHLESPKRSSSSSCTNNRHLKPFSLGDFSIRFNAGLPQTPGDTGTRDLIVIEKRNRSAAKSPFVCLRVPHCRSKNGGECKNDTNPDLNPLVESIGSLVAKVDEKPESELVKALARFSISNGGELSLAPGVPRPSNLSKINPLRLYELEEHHMPALPEPKQSFFCVEPSTASEGLKWREIEEKGSETISSSATIHAADVSGLSRRQTKELEKFCQSHFKTSFSKFIDLQGDGRLHWSMMQNGVFSIPLMVFEPDTTHLYRITKHSITAVLDKKGVLFITPTDSPFVHRALSELATRDDAGYHVQSTGRLLFYVLDQCLDESEKTIRKLDNQVVRIWQNFKNGRLNQLILDDEVQELSRSLSYIQRKLAEMSDITAIAIERFAEVNQDALDPSVAEKRLKDFKVRTNRLHGQAQDNINELKELASAFDLQLKLKTDKNLELFTIIIGYSAPPIIADVACKFFGIHEDPRFFVGAMGVAVLAHLYAKFKYWKTV